ncbi:MAG: TrkH family potassium uptake protein, partial [Pirellulales bacterium]|nr:TrkH family potassium uptake protein [Pirellulales bacterium]
MSLPWAFPLLGEAKHGIEWRSVGGLLGAMMVCSGVGATLMWIGRSESGAELLRREAMVVVGLSWILAMVLGALPFWFSGTAWSRT